MKLLTVYGYTAVVAVVTTIFSSLTKGIQQDCEQDCGQKGQVVAKSIKKFGHVEGVIVNTVTGPLALGYFIVRLMRTDPSINQDNNTVSV